MYVMYVMYVIYVIYLCYVVISVLTFWLISVERHSRFPMCLPYLLINYACTITAKPKLKLHA